MRIQLENVIIYGTIWVLNFNHLLIYLRTEQIMSKFMHEINDIL